MITKPASPADGVLHKAFLLKTASNRTNACRIFLLRQAFFSADDSSPGRKNVI